MGICGPHRRFTTLASTLQSDAAMQTEHTDGPTGALQGLPQLAGKYLAFRTGGIGCGVPILKVLEIIRPLEITSLPGAPDYVRGVINLRGRIFPVLDLGLRLGLTPVPTSEQAVIMIVMCVERSRTVTVGLLVDDVSEVLHLDGAQIEPPVELAGATRTFQPLLGIGKTHDACVFLLDLDEAVTGLCTLDPTLINAA
jgi:purine-binding chemotaxis protein CheW